MAIDAPEFAFSEQQPGTGPAFALITRSPPLDVAEDSTNGIENGFDRIECGVLCAARLHIQLVQGERFFQSVLEAARSARIHTRQFADGSAAMVVWPS
jgi:hypothetical protein